MLVILCRPFRRQALRPSVCRPVRNVRLFLCFSSFFFRSRLLFSLLTASSDSLQMRVHNFHGCVTGTADSAASIFSFSLLILLPAVTA